MPRRASSASADIPEIYGNVIDSWALDELGLYRLPKSGGDSFELIATGFDGDRDGVALGGVYYLTEYIYPPDDDGFYGYVRGIDLSTGEIVSEAGVTYDGIPVTVTVNPADGKAYGIFLREDDSGYAFRFGTIDYTSASPAVTHLADIEDGTYTALAANANGQFFVLRDICDENYETIDSEFLRLDPATGSLTQIGTVGFFSNYDTDAVIDPATGRMFYATSTYDGARLVEIDTATGIGTALFDFENQEEIVGMFCPGPSIAAGAPAQVSDLELTFVGGALTGKVNFRTPSALQDGTPAEGTFTAHLTVDGEERQTLEVNCGGQSCFDAAVEAPGNHTFGVFLSNSAGAGAPRYAGAFIGEDTPRPLAFAAATYADGVMTVCWDSPAGVNGGWLDLSKISYTVERILPEPGTVVEETAATSVEIPMQAPEEKTVFTFKVIMSCAGAFHSETVTDPVSLGALLPPYSQDFSGDNPLEDYEIIDANADGYTWKVFDDCVRIESSRTEPSDDWLILPALHLRADAGYNLSFRTWAAAAVCPERIEVKAGLAPAAEAMTTTLLGPTDVTALFEDAVTLGTLLKPSATGDWYIGFHAVSDADMFYLYLDDINLEETAPEAAPAPVTDFTVTPDPLGNRNIKITFAAPAVCADGTPLASIDGIDVLSGETVLRRFDAPVPGEVFELEYEPESFGEYTLGVTVRNAVGSSETLWQTVYCGPDIPGAVAGLSLTESPEGTVVVSWDAVAADHTGKAINPELIRYNVFTVSNGELTPHALNFRGTELSVPVVGGDRQDFAQLAVYGVTDKGQGVGMTSEMLPVGKPYKDFAESFAATDLSHVFGVKVSNGGQLGLYESLDGITAQDNDGGFLVIYGNNGGAAAELLSGKIDLDALERPELSAWLHILSAEDRNKVSLDVREAEGAFSRLMTIAVGESGQPGWNRIAVPLDDYAGKIIQFRLVGTIENYGSIVLDNIRIGALSGLDSVKEGICTACAGPGCIMIEAPKETCFTVSSVDGRTVSAGSLNGQTVVPVSPGIYIVSIDKAVVKVAVR